MTPEPIKKLLPATGFARTAAVCETCGISRTSLYRLTKEGRFPRPVSPPPFGSSITVWRWEDIHSFIRGEWKAAEGVTP